MSRGRHEFCPICGRHVWTPKGILASHWRKGKTKICEGSNQDIANLKEGDEMTRDYTIQPLKVTPWTFLGEFDEYEAKEASWPQELITACLQEIQRRELLPNVGLEGKQKEAV